MVNHSLDVVRKALDLYTPLGLAVSFNGGKDACTVLFLLMTVLAERGQLGLLCGPGGDEGKMLVICFDRDEFAAVQEFTQKVAERYGLTLRHYKATYRDGMEDLVQNHGTKAVLMGQRYGDPWTDGMDDFTPSTPGWPEFVRLNPILRWPYDYVWRFLRRCRLPYCHLYDEGYTSLGEAVLTIKNPALRRPDGTYIPAYELHDPALERSNRSPRVNGGPKTPAFPEGVLPPPGVGEGGAGPLVTADGAGAPALNSATSLSPVPSEPKGLAAAGGQLPGGVVGQWRRVLPAVVVALAVVGAVQLKVFKRP
ncbi:FAD synthetase [Tribonema minus]|uniref:FAD synthase n=1 Tax=Tribonema minus TaxID=303371 RepID=A0A835YNH1_9STRA|nr:FAD synthetase [Tribonema minus]